MAKKTALVAAAKAEFAEILPAVERWHAMAIRHSRIAIWCAACCGQELIERRKGIGHGGWLKFVNVLPFGIDTARKYMELAEEWKFRTGQIPTAIGISSENRAKLISGEVIELQPSDILSLSEEVVGKVGETTLRQLYFDWGICKAPARPGGNVRKGDKGVHTLTVEEIHATCAETWVRMVEELTEHGRRQKTFVHLTDGEIAAHREGLKRVLDELDAEIARRVKKGAGR
jgi:hypothetical protein